MSDRIKKPVEYVVGSKSRQDLAAFTEGCRQFILQKIQKDSGSFAFTKELVEHMKPIRPVPVKPFI
jgi:hypothetical protein